MRRFLAALTVLALAVQAPAQIVFTPPGSSTNLAGQVLLYGQGALNLPTTGTVEEVLLSVAVPANTFPTNYMGFRIEAFYTAAANANNKSVGLKLGGLAGTAIWASTSNVSAQTFALTATCVVTAADQLHCLGTQSLLAGTTAGNFYSTAAIASTFANATTLDLTATTATASADVTLRSVRVFLLTKA